MKLLALLLALALALTACGGGSDDGAGPTARSTAPAQRVGGQQK